MLPELTAENQAFWTGGADGRLMIAHCDACDAAIHPPEVVCPICLGRSVTPRPCLGTGTVYSFTVNHQAWTPDMTLPFALVVVDLDDEPGIRVTAEFADDTPDRIAIGDRVGVGFSPVEDVWIPHFKRLTQ